MKKRKRAPFTVPAPVIAVPKPPPASKGPIFTAVFADGVQTKMSIYSGLDPLDLERASVISKAAYSSRTKTPMAAAPRIIFEDREGEPLASYTADQLNTVADLRVDLHNNGEIPHCSTRGAKRNNNEEKS